MLVGAKKLLTATEHLITKKKYIKGLDFSEYLNNLTANITEMERRVELLEKEARFLTRRKDIDE